MIRLFQAPKIIVLTLLTFCCVLGIHVIIHYDETDMNKKLTPEEINVMVYKATEAPFTGKYVDHFEKGRYRCKRCQAVLFTSSAKFHSNCGWPSFDDQVPNAVRQIPDPDGFRTEILCATCDAHLGHVFHGEGFTPKNTRYCVNSIAMEFVPEESTAMDKFPTNETPTETAVFASGCFWGTQHYLDKAPGILSTTVGYTGGRVPHPTYKQVCTGTTGHAEAVQVVFDPNETSFEKLAVLFFETHDFTQLNRQGPDIGPQYRSAIFHQNESQRLIAQKLIDQLKQKGYDVKTELTPAAVFYPAEDYHQDYYQKNGQTPYCHRYRKIF